MKTEFYSKSYLKDGKYIIEEIQKTIFDVILLVSPLKATITHVGGNGRFIFLVNGLSYVTTFVDNLCQVYTTTPNQEIDNNYYDYQDIEFNINVKEEWSKLYIYNESKEYWKPI